MNQLVPNRLRELWQQVDRQELTVEAFQGEIASIPRTVGESAPPAMLAGLSHIVGHG